MNREVKTHCFNCTDRDSTELPERYQGIEVKSLRGVSLCPRCKCPEVATVNADYSPSYGYLNTKQD